MNMARKKLTAILAAGHMQEEDQDLTLDAMESLRPELFDFLFRMSGQRESVLRILDESTVALKSNLKWDRNDADEFIVEAFSTARSFSADVWNADTSQLINLAYKNESEDQSELLDLEAQMGALPGWEREPILLTRHLQFSDEEAARIMSVPTASIRESCEAGLKRLSTAMNLSEGAICERMRHLALHPSQARPMSGANPTLALSQIMGDIDDANRGRWWRKVFLLLLALSATGFLMVYVLSQ